jgi:hypothetical protein
MSENNLRAALTAAGLQPGDLADLVRVDERTARRWLAGGIPYARHRTKLARALDTTPEQLWPHLATPPNYTTAEAAPATDTITAYTNPESSDTPTTHELVAEALSQVDLIDGDNGTLVRESGLIDLLIAKARDGCHVRIIVSAPNRALAPLLTKAGIEIRLSESDEHPVMHHGDDHILAWLTLS